MIVDNKSLKVVGIMTGTSLDGIDIYFGKFSNTSFEKIFFSTVPYTNSIIKQVTKVLNDQGNLSELCDLNYNLGNEYKNAIIKAFKDNGFSTDDIDLISMHGQTIWHNDGVSTLQIGQSSILSEYFHVPVIDDFRSADIATKNNGAPLIYLFDQYLINNKKDNVITLNIGGISNIASLKYPSIAFDTGPGNMIIDHICKMRLGIKYDKNGEIARSGKVIDNIINDQLEHPYFKKQIPKTTGREEFGNLFCEEMLSKYENINTEDLVATFSMLTCITIANAIVDNIVEDENNIIYVSGGGAYNLFLMETLKTLLPTYKIEIIDKLGTTAEEKEAAAFAYFGYCRYYDKPMQLLNGTEALLGKVTKVYILKGGK